MKLFLLFFLEYVASFSTPLDDVAAAAGNNSIVPQVIPSINLKTRLSIAYSQPDGNYTNCDVVYSFPAGTFALNDTGIAYTTPWYARSYRPIKGDTTDFFQYVPEIAWEPETPTTLYTLMMVDPLFIIDPNHPWGPYVQHYMQINIIGNNLTTGVVVNPLLGPGPSDPNYHKYVFVLYAQNSTLNLTVNETAAIQERVHFNVSTFLAAHDLVSAAAINWMYAMGDTWGPVEQDKLGFSKLDCFVPVEAAAKANGIVPSVLPVLNLTTHLRVTYKQPKGNFSNCGKLYSNPAVEFSLNDTGATIQTPWNARSYRPNDYFSYHPDVSWDAPDNTTWYALVMIDAGDVTNSTFKSPFIDHWMVLNIPGNNLAAGQVINAPLGPAPIDAFAHLYTFVLYRQNDVVTLDDGEKKALSARTGFNLTNFTLYHNMSAPAGVNWLYSAADPWSPVVQDALNITKLDCFRPVEDAAWANGIVPVIVPFLNLTTRLMINYDQPEGNFTNCGVLNSFPAITFSLNDTGITTQTPWNTRSYRPTPEGGKSDYFRYAPDITWEPDVATLYTLLMVDPLFILNETSPWGPYVEHYMVLNILGNNISSGDVINSLLGPAPTDPDYHKYLFLLYRQPGTVALDKNETEAINGRVNFDLPAFLTKHGYTTGPVGINWVYASRDSWAPVVQDALGFAPLDCFGAVEEAASHNKIVPDVVPYLNLTTRLSVRYNQPAASYMKCGVVIPNDPVNFTLDDTSITHATPWNMRSYRQSPLDPISDFFQYQPEVTWNPESPTTLYTLMMIDPVFVVNDTHQWGPYIQHWLVVNIPGNDTSKGELINPLLGPGPNEPNTYHKYTFVLYKQPGVLTLTPDERGKITNRTNFVLSAFIAAHNLTGAAGINWGYAMVDSWALVQLDRLGLVALNCFDAVNEVASYLGIVPNIIPALDLNTQLFVSFNQPAGSFTNCDHPYPQPAFNKSLSDTDHTLVYQYPWDLRSYRPGPNKTAAITAYTPSITWEAATGMHSYTLLVVDPVYILDPQDPSGPFVIHYMVININGTDLKTGKEINPYFGPAPLDPLYHKYLFLLYHQTEPISLTPAQITKLQTRRAFSLPQFVEEHALGNPVGANWALAQADLWSPVAQDAIGFKPLKCPLAPSPGPADKDYVHLTPGGFAAIMVVGGLVILALLAYVCYQRSQRSKVGTDYGKLSDGEGIRKTSVNRRE